MYSASIVPCVRSLGSLELSSIIVNTLVQNDSKSAMCVDMSLSEPPRMNMSVSIKAAHYKDVLCMLQSRL